MVSSSHVSWRLDADDLSRVHAAWCFQASRLRLVSLPLKVCQPVSTGFLFPNRNPYVAVLLAHYTREARMGTGSCSVKLTSSLKQQRGSS